MGKKTTAAFLVILVIGGILLGVLFYPNSSIYVLNPTGVIGFKERDLFAFATAVMQIVVIPVFILTVVFARKYRSENQKATYDPNLDENPLAEIIWWGVPIIIIGAFSYLTWTKSHELDPFKPLVSDAKPMNIQVVALRWKWLFLYPEEGVASVNVVHLPLNTPIHFELTAESPINSFWIPQLAGQVYAMPRMRTELHLMADQAGKFRGSSANLSGRGFAGMTFFAHAMLQEEFDQWVVSAKHSQNVLDEKSYQTLAQPSEYVPPEIYVLTQKDLFQRILQKYMEPGNMY